jgi:hypothetical protein
VLRLAGYDRAAVAQAASLLRARDPVGFRAAVQTLLESATPDVAAGLREYSRATDPKVGANLY